MKFFRKIKYRLRRFIISLISVLCLSCVFIVSASADVLPLSDKPIVTDVDPYYWNGSQWIYSDTVRFTPGKTVNTGLVVPYGEAFGMTFTNYSDTGSNYLNVSRGTLHFKISFITNIYLNAPWIPYLSFGRWSQDSDGQVIVDSSTVESQYFTTKSSSVQYDGSGDNKRFLVTTEIFVNSSHIPYSDFFSFYFYIQRDKSPTTDREWVIVFDEFVCEVLTGSDVPSYSAPDTSAKNELDSTEETLNHTFESYNVRLDGIFDLTGTTGLLTAVGWWSQNIFGLFINNPLLSSILTLSLAVGIFSLLFGLFGSIIGRTGKPGKTPKNVRNKKGG